MGERGLDAVGFDLDYTLWDQDQFARSFFDQVAGEFGRRLGLGRRRVAQALHASLDRLTLAHPALFDFALHRLGAWDPRLVAELVDRYHRHRPPARPYPAAAELLGRLRRAGLRLFLVTDGPPELQRHKVQALGFQDEFAAAVYTGELPEAQRKPSPAPFLLACGRLGVAPARCAYVGDNPECDFAGPLGLGMLVIGVGTGPYAARASASAPAPDRRVRSLEGVAEALAAQAALERLPACLGDRP
jgi:putative hydrolase of the HAD superfamily